MTTYNTGNPLGSVDVRDLYDNAENADNFSNGPLDAYPDRFGVSRQSLQGIRNASQYQVIGAYAAGLQITALNQVFSYLGEYYAPGPSITLPYTTTGVGAAEIANFRPVGDAILRADLANATDPAKGAGLVGYKGRTLGDKLNELVSVTDLANDSDPAKGAGLVGRALQSVSTIAELRTLKNNVPSRCAEVLGYYSKGDGGGGPYYLDAVDMSSVDNGGTVIVAEDGGRWKLSHHGIVSVKQFGALGDGVANDSAAIQAAIDHASGDAPFAVYAPAGSYYCGTATLTINANISIYGAGKMATVFTFAEAASPAVAVSQDSATVGVSLSGFTLRGALGGKTGLKLGNGSIARSTVDARFQNLRIEFMSIGVDTTYSWGCQWDNSRIQSCTKPAALGSQTNATLFNNVSFVSFTAPMSFVNCEGIELNSCNISNHLSATEAMTLSQASVILRNPYFEGNAPKLARVGSGGQAYGSTFRVEGGILNSSTTIEYRGLADISVNGLRIDTAGAELKVEPNGSSGLAKLQDISWQCKRTATDSINLHSRLYTRNYQNFSPFANAFGGGSLSYELFPTHLSVTQGGASNGISMGSVVVGEQYTVALYARRGTAASLEMRGGNNAAPTGPLSIPLSNTEFEQIVIPFVATESVVRLLFAGSLDVKEVSLFSGVVGRSVMDVTAGAENLREWRYSSAPVSGTWQAGSIVLSTVPTAGGYSGWVCTASGTPGTWKGYGAIQA